MVEFHNPGFLFRSKTLATTISVIDIIGKVHLFAFAPCATISKFKVTSNLYWLSCCGKPLCGNLPLNEITGTVIMHGRLIGGIQCCSKSYENEAESQKFDSTIG